MVRSFSDRSIRRAISTVAAMVLIATPVQGQETPSDREAVLAVVQTLFDGMRARDADVVGGVFHEGAQMFRAPQVGGDGTVRSGSTEGFVNAVGGGTEVWDEPVWDPVVQVRDNLATVWIKYAFRTLFSRKTASCLPSGRLKAPRRAPRAGLESIDRRRCQRPARNRSRTVSGLPLRPNAALPPATLLPLRHPHRPWGPLPHPGAPHR